MQINYEQKLTAIADTVTIPDQRVSPAVIALGARSLEGIDARYGPESENPLGFHVGPHSLGVVRRNILLSKLLYEFIPEEQQQGIFNLDMAVGSTHDWEQLLGPGKNEVASAQYLLEELTASGEPELNTPRFRQRAEDGSLATAVEFKENGEIVQFNLQTGEPDAFMFISSFGDINGIAIDGRRRMLNDAARLAREKYRDSMTLRQLDSYMIIQEGFLRKRLNDHRIKSDIAYHFPNEDTAKAVYDVMYHEFHANILAAHAAAVIMGRPPVRLAIKGLAIVDQVIGKRLTKAVYGALTIPD
jgi:hypothetical protein